MDAHVKTLSASLAQALFALFLLMMNVPASSVHYYSNAKLPSPMQNPPPEVAMAEGNAQRSRVLPTKSVDITPQQLIWRLEKLFKIVSFEPFTLQNGPFTIKGDLPTGQSFTFPIVSEGILFFTLDVGTAYFYAIDAINGKQLVTLEFDRNRLSGPAAIGHTAFFGTDSGRVYAYDVDRRKTKWIFEQKDRSFAYSDPAVDQGVVYICGWNIGLFALAADTGAVRWIFKSNDPLYGPAIKDDDLILYDPKGLMISVDRRTGTKRWESKIGRNFYIPAILDDQIIVGHEEGEIRAYALNDGSLRWKSKKDGGAQTALVLFKDTVFYGERYGNIVALDARTGLEKWRFKTKQPCGQPIIAGDTLYTSCRDRNMYAIESQTGQEKWKWENKKAVPPPPTFAGGIIYFLGGDGSLTAMK